jgi:hypothetical protein
MLEEVGGHLRGLFPSTAVELEPCLIGPNVDDTFLNVMNLGIGGTLGNVARRQLDPVLTYRTADEVRIRAACVLLEIVLEGDGEARLQFLHTRENARVQQGRAEIIQGVCENFGVVEAHRQIERPLSVVKCFVSALIAHGELRVHAVSHCQVA